jgi:hypothetical protein
LKKTCGTYGALYVACAIVMGFLAWRRIDIAAIPAAIIGGAILWMGLAYLAGIPDKMVRASRIRRALNGEPPRDGTIIAAVGRITPIGETLSSPFQRVNCVAYSYRVRVPDRKMTRTDYNGVALTPSMIEGPHGAVKLLAWPELDVPETNCRGDELRRNALEFVARTPFTIPQMFKPDVTTSPGVRYDHQNASPDNTLQYANLYESVLRPGEEVCALGWYSATEGGLTHEPGQLVPSLTIMNGDATAIQRRLVRRCTGNFIGGMIFVTAAAAGMFALYASIPLEASEQMSPNRTTWWWEARLERLIDRHMKRDETVPTNFVAGHAHGRIVVGNREVRPTIASATRDGKIATVTFDNGDATATIDTNSNRLVQLDLLGTTVAQEAELEVLNDDTQSIEGRITLLGENARCRLAFKAAYSGR